MTAPNVPATIRANVADEWLLADFGRDLISLETAYLRVAAFLYADDSFETRRRVLLSSELELAEWSARHITDAEEGVEERGRVRPPKLTSTMSRLLREVEGELPPLRLATIRIASPGFVEAVAELNPLKVVADFVTHWREENRLRTAQTTEAETRRRELDLRERELQLKALSELSAQVRENVRLGVELAESIGGAVGANAQRHLVERTLALAAEGLGGVQWLNYLLRPARKEMIEIAADPRITSLALMSGGAEGHEQDSTHGGRPRRQDG